MSCRMRRIKTWRRVLTIAMTFSLGLLVIADGSTLVRVPETTTAQKEVK
jgi:hypothetical protein